MAHPAHLQLPQLVFDELIGRAGQRLSTQVDEAPKIIQNPQKIVFFFFQKWRASLVSFLLFFSSLDLGLAQEQTTRGGGKERRRYF
jgi:hypothetical protein